MDTTNEPVAWLIQAKIWHEFTFSKPAEDSEDVVILPLYTHPHSDKSVKAKTLTESEFENIVDACDLSGDWDTQYDFSKMFRLVNEAILKNASEK